MFKRFFNALIEARQQSANRKIAAHLGKFEYPNEDPHYVANYIYGDKK